MNFAENLIKQKEWGYAITQLRNMLNHPKLLKGLEPERIYLDIGICLLAKGDHQGAMDNWHEVLNYNPDNAAAHLQLALLLDSERHISSALKEYKEYIRLSPDNAETVKIKNRVLLLEQNLRAEQIDIPVQNQTHIQSRYKPNPTNKNETNNFEEETGSVSTNNKAVKQEKKRDALEPKSGKESGF